jgi:hypothetical protein
MLDTFEDDPTIPPPGKRTGAGVGSIVPFLVKSLATKPQASSNEDDARPPAPLDPEAAARSDADQTGRPDRTDRRSERQSGKS